MLRNALTIVGCSLAATVASAQQQPARTPATKPAAHVAAHATTTAPRVTTTPVAARPVTTKAPADTTTRHAMKHVAHATKKHHRMSRHAASRDSVKAKKS